MMRGECFCMLGWLLRDEKRVSSKHMLQAHIIFGVSSCQSVFIILKLKSGFCGVYLTCSCSLLSLSLSLSPSLYCQLCDFLELFLGLGSSMN
ncbi:hypothetical protein Syun_015941 [Stephania yunnanensis]|uniref:Uncharacterized protein n=1 Tax=Stephania yunnanensis TaxID=152371 RepID=A0AAP0J484_9MAGN